MLAAQRWPICVLAIWNPNLLRQGSSWSVARELPRVLSANAGNGRGSREGKRTWRGAREQAADHASGVMDLWRAEAHANPKSLGSRSS